MNLFETFKRAREERPNEPAFLIAAGDRYFPISWRQFTDDIAALVWMAEHLAPGVTIALIGENSYEWITFHAASLFGGVTIVPIDFNLSAVDAASRIRSAGASLLIHSALYAEKAQEIGKLVPGLEVGGFGTRRSERYFEHARKALAGGDQCVFERETIDSNRISMMVFTSGTTSEPRGVELTTRGVEVFVECWTKTVEIPPDSRSLMLLPLHHIFGLSTTYFMLSQGVPLGICPDFRRLYDAVERFRANCLFLVPALAGILATKIEHRGKSAVEALGAPIDWIVVGGAPMSRLDWERLNALGIQILGGYGLTETTALFSVMPTAAAPAPGCAGRVPDHPEVEAKVSETGELMTRGPHVFIRYHNRPDKTAAAKDAEGWFHTGDLGRIDADGTVWITGRASRTIILSSGKKVAPEELEGRILELPGVLEVIVSGNGTTREIRAEIYASVPESFVRRSVEGLNRTLPGYSRIAEVVIRDTPFPRTSSGKIRL